MDMSNLPFSDLLLPLPSFALAGQGVWSGWCRSDFLPLKPTPIGR